MTSTKNIPFWLFVLGYLLFWGTHIALAVLR
jgi:hypothetical protein